MGNASRTPHHPARGRAARAHEGVERGEFGAPAVLSALRGQLQRAQSLLVKPKTTDARVHSARKEVKKARAMLRLLRASLSEAVYRRENVALRDAARILSAVRDAKVVIQTLDGLPGGKPGAADLALRKAFVRDRATARRFLSRTRTASARRALRLVSRRSRSWRMRAHDEAALCASLVRTYRRARRAFAPALAQRDDAALHECRKQATYLWRQLELLRPIRPAALGSFIARTHKLASCLGDDHDLALIEQEVVKRGRTFAEPAEIEGLLKRAQRQRGRLQRKAAALGKLLFDESPKQFEKRLQRWVDQGRAPRAKSGERKQRRLAPALCGDHGFSKTIS